MPTASERARGEAEVWARLAEHWTEDRLPDLWADRPPTEREVIVFHDPVADLAARAGKWSLELPRSDLSELARFAAGLAATEAEGWEKDKPDLATRAYEDRRFLLGDRVIHWAVPWLDAVGRCYPDHREVAQADHDRLLGLAEEARVAPVLPGTEGLLATGEDSYGPVDPSVELPAWLRSLWSGMVRLDVASPATADDYAQAARRWSDLAEAHPGSAQLWWDLSRRAEATAALL